MYTFYLLYIPYNSPTLPLLPPCRSSKAVEDRVVRREVAGRFPSPGPGRYTGGIGVDKLGEWDKA